MVRALWVHCRLASYCTDAYITGCGKEGENKAFQPLFLSHSLTITLILSFSVISAISCRPAPPLLKMLDSGLATAYRNGTYRNKGRRDGRLSKDQHGAQLKENKKLQISKKRRSTSALSYQNTGSLSCKSRLIFSLRTK